MTDNNHPITPTPELIRKWAQYRGFESPEVLWRQIATQAARWGADYELEACCALADERLHDGTSLRTARRPKSKSQADEALECLEQTMILLMPVTGRKKVERLGVIRRAIESLPE